MGRESEDQTEPSLETACTQYGRCPPAKTTKKAPAKRKYTKKPVAKKVEAPTPEPVVEVAPKKSKKKEVSRFQSRRR